MELYQIDTFRKSGHQLWSETLSRITLVEQSNLSWVGKWVELVGVSGSGKTLFCINTVARYLALHPMDTAIWLDINQQFNAKKFYHMIPEDISTHNNIIVRK
jgi:Ni2+-binding GTPase involved in maturation of urease and hydrogenase